MSLVHRTEAEASRAGGRRGVCGGLGLNVVSAAWDGSWVRGDEMTGRSSMAWGGPPSYLHTDLLVHRSRLQLGAVALGGGGLLPQPGSGASPVG